MYQDLISSVLPFAALVAITVPQAKPSATLQARQPQQLEVREWVVRSGETLSSIAKREYGSIDYWTNIWDDNPWIKNPNVIEKDWKLKLSATKPEKVDTLKPELAKLYKETSYEFVFTNAPVASYSAGQVALVSQSQAQPQTSPSSYDSVYQEAGAKYGIPWQVLYGLHITETGGRDGAIFNKQGSGAQGPMQFMPGTWKAYGADGNGDGTADINNAVDAIHGAANYLAKHGSLDQGLRSYGGNKAGTLNLARSRGLSQ